MENVVFLNFQCVKGTFFPDAAAFFVFERHMIFITSPYWLVSSSLIFTSSLSLSLVFSPSLSRCAAVSVSFHHPVSSVHINQFLVQGLGSIQPMSGVTSTPPLSHEELEIDFDALDEQCPSVAKQGPSGQKTKLRSSSSGTPREAGTDGPCKRSRSSGTLG